MRVAVLDPSLFSPEYDAQLCHALGEVGHDVTLVTRVPRPDETVPAGRFDVVRHGYELSERIRCRYPRLYRYPKVVEHAASLYRLPRLLDGLAPDVVHLQWSLIPTLDQHLVTRLSRDRPVVLTIHNVEPLHGRPRSRLQSAGTQRLVAAADAVVVHGAQARRALVAQGVSPDSIHVIPHGLLPPSHGGTRPGERDDERSGSDPVRLLFFGRLRSYKGLDILVRALALLAPGVRERITLSVVGIPDEPVDRLQALAETLGVAAIVHWDLRFVPDLELARIIDATDVLMLPYRRIDASGVLMKALAHAKPVVVTNVGTLPDLVTDGRNGLVVEPGDPRTLAGAIGRLVQEPGLLDRLRTGAVAAAEAVPRWVDLAATTVGVYEACVEARRASTSIASSA